MKVAAMQASLDHQSEAPMSVLIVSSEHFDDFTSASSGAQCTNNDNGRNPSASKDLDMTRSDTDAARQQISAAGDQLSSTSRRRRLALLDQRDRHDARVTLSESDKTKALQSMLRINDGVPGTSL